MTIKPHPRIMPEEEEVTVENAKETLYMGAYGALLPIVTPALPKPPTGWFQDKETPLFRFFSEQSGEIESAYDSVQNFFRTVLDANLRFEDDEWTLKKVQGPILKDVIAMPAYSPAIQSVLHLKGKPVETIFRTFAKSLELQAGRLLKRMLEACGRLSNAELIGLVNFAAEKSCYCRGEQWLVGELKRNCSDQNLESLGFELDGPREVTHYTSMHEMINVGKHNERC